MWKRSRKYKEGLHFLNKKNNHVFFNKYLMYTIAWDRNKYSMVLEKYVDEKGYSLSYYRRCIFLFVMRKFGLVKGPLVRVFQKKRVNKYFKNLRD